MDTPVSVYTTDSNTVHFRPEASAIVQAQRLSLFGHTVRMPDNTDAKISTAALLENWMIDG